ncbi:MAG: hypothetical protein JSU71_11170 [Betaproteobacteria bacterium]|jgi:hypothetical protein|nr:MAG: hypothetical protein JSU71_11170 [Betaproteobacteria bacterium]
MIHVTAEWEIGRLRVKAKLEQIFNRQGAEITAENRDCTATTPIILKKEQEAS